MSEGKVLQNIMWVNSIRWFLFFSAIPALDGTRKLMKVYELTPVEMTVKTIFESCYENDKSFNPIVIFGDFHWNIEKASIIRINTILGIKNYEQYAFKAKAIILIPDTREELESVLKSLWKTEWWDYITPFFIIERYTQGCKNFKEILNATWSNDIVSSIYICAGSINTSVLYTSNPMTNYAPHPWERTDGIDDLNVFHQVFDSSISCKDLNYDKTRNLTRYEVRGVLRLDEKLPSVSQKRHWGIHIPNYPVTNILGSIIRALNVSGEFEVRTDPKEVARRMKSGSSDIMMNENILDSLRKWPCFSFPYIRERLIAVVKLEPEISTLQKISKLWSTPVLIAAAIVFAFLTLILTIKNHNFFVAVLDIVRLLTYTSIQTNNQSHSFRIYFTTMLIFMVISNGVFQGKIASFLTKRERNLVVGTMKELADSGYKMHIVGSLSRRFNKLCPKCHFKGALASECIDHVLDNTRHLCVMDERQYHLNYSQLELDYVREISVDFFGTYTCRKHWPLKNHFNDRLLRLYRSGIIDFLKNRENFVPRQKRVAREAEWSSGPHRPVKLYKLKFAFQVLALGLVLSAIAFVVELYRGYYKITKKKTRTRI